MNRSKIYAYVTSGVVLALNLVQIAIPFMPPVWSDFATSLLALLVSYHLYQSHTETALAAGGYTRQ